MKTFEFDFEGIKDDWETYDVLLDEVKTYCHPDVPTEIVVHSKDPIQLTNENPLLSKLYDENKQGEKVVVVVNLNGRRVELIRNPVMGGRLTVIVCKNPKDTKLTFLEARNILNEVEKLIGVDIRWGRPFPRGSC